MNYSLNEKAKIVLIARRVARSSDTSEIIDFFEQKLLGPPNPESKQCPICKINETVRINIPVYRCINCHHEWKITFPDISETF